MYKHELLYRKDLSGFEKNICICGVGALGSNLTDTLIRHGFTNIRIIDFDRVSEENIGTQIYTMNDIGSLKVDALQNRMFEISEVQIDTFAKRLEIKNLNKQLKSADLVIDCFDNEGSRQLLKDWGNDKNPVIHAGLFEDFGEVKWNDKYIVPENNNDIDICDYPLARNIIMLTVTVLCEEVIRFCLGESLNNYHITLKDLQIRCVS